MKAHIEYAHNFWEAFLRPGDVVIDATCGNGKDTLKLAHLVLTNESGLVIGLDIQAAALAKTRATLEQAINPRLLKRIFLFEQSHASFPEMAYAHPIQLIVYNLGYLPGSDKTITTQTASTLLSLAQAQKIIAPDGVICITCYPGHVEGIKEQAALSEVLQGLDPQKWTITWPILGSNPTSPKLLLIKKISLINKVENNDNNR